MLYVAVQRVEGIMASSLVVCIGNELVADDAVGHALYQRLTEESLGGEVRLSLLGVGGMAVVDELTGEDRLIVVDAVQFGSTPGTVHVLDWDQIPCSGMRPVSGHGIGIREALQVCRKLFPEKAASEAWLVGIEGECFNRVGAGLSPKVRDALPQAVERIVQLTC